MTTNNGYHTKATGEAFNTAEEHSGDHEFKLYGACFCPFVQRVWIALEFRNDDYQYIEVDPYSKPKELTDINPKGLVPSLRHGNWGMYESTVLMEYLEDIKRVLLPADARDRAYIRLWNDFANRNIIPSFYRLLQAQDPEKQVEAGQEMQDSIDTFTKAMDAQGPYFNGPEFGFVDASLAPWALRIEKVLKPYRGWEPPRDGRWGTWLAATLGHPAVKATTSTDDLYLDSYKRYAENRPNTSQVANAINSGRNLP